MARFRPQEAQVLRVKSASGNHINAANRAPVRNEQDLFVMKLIRVSGLFGALSWLLLVCSCRQEHGNENRGTARTSRFVPGQVWTFRTPTNDLPGAALTIVRIELDTKRGPIIYVSVPLLRPAKWEGTNTFCPFSEDALNRSVIALVRTNASLTSEDMEVFQQVYKLARKDTGNTKFGKCFDITVAEVLAARRKAK